MASSLSDPAHGALPGVTVDRRDDPSLDELLQILDAASDLRRERELVDEQLNLEQIRLRLRDRLIAAAKASGNVIQEEEVELAIDTYYSRMHAYSEPPPGLEIVLAHLYVRRLSLLLASGIALSLLLGIWFLFLRPSAPLTITGRTKQAVTRLVREADESARLAEALAVDPATKTRIAQLRQEEAVARGQEDTAALAGVVSRLEGIRNRLEEEYVVEIVREPGRRSAFQTHNPAVSGDRVSGYYVIVEARAPDGRKLPRRVRNEERDSTETVSTWAERVPKEVYDRLAADKKADGRLDEHVFSVKQRGRMDEEMALDGADGRPVSRLGQITNW